MYRRLVPVALGLSGVWLRVHAFMGDHSLSIDEAALARNLIERQWSGLIGPLDYGQVAPLGFLFAEKGLLTALGSDEHALRLLPLVCGLVSLWLCWMVSRRVLPWPLAACALALCAWNNSLIEYSAIAKQYSLDVAAALLIALVAIEAIERPATVARARWLGLAGAATAACSFTAVFGLGAAAAAGLLAAFQRHERHLRRPRLVAAALWLAGAAAGALVARAAIDPLDAQYMQFWWSSGFMPMPPDLGDLSWLWQRLENLFGRTGQYRATIGWILLMLLGVQSLYQRRRLELVLVLAAPLVLTVFAASARLYPFTWGRLQLFLLPLVLILVVEGATYCLRLTVLRSVRLLPIVIVMALGAFATVGGAGRAPVDEIKPFLRHVKAQWRTGDRLWVYHRLSQAFLYYAPRFGFSADAYTLGTCSAGSARSYLRELDALRPYSRAWILIPHYRFDEGELIVRYLNVLGTMDSRDEANSDAGIDRRGIGYVLDLDARAASATRADRFPVPPEMDRPEPYPWMCHGVFQPLVRKPSR